MLIFNIMVDAIVREWLYQVLGTEAARYAYCKAIHMLMAIVYDDNPLLASRDPKLLQEMLDIIIGLFERVGLQTNTTKMKVMICVPGELRTHHPNITYNCIQEGLVVSSDMQTRNMDCDICCHTLMENKSPITSRL